MADYNKDPPRGYLSEGADLLGGLDEIARNLNASVYSNEYDFLVDLEIFAGVRVRDLHLPYGSLLLDLFTFERGVKFVSVSKDGMSVPDVFLYG